MKPYERSMSRVHAMYGIPTPPPRKRVLELCYGRPPLLTGSSWRGGQAIVCVLRGSAPVEPGSLVSDRPLCLAHYARDLPFAANAFDLVILHDSLDRLIECESEMRARAASVKLLDRIRGVLAVDGIIAGCAANRTSLGRWWRARFVPSEAVAHRRPSATLSIRSCRALLARAGFVDIETFSILPSAESPLRLINTQADLSRIGFRRELEGVRESLSRSGYLLRWAVIALALNRFFEESILFWARAR